MITGAPATGKDGSDEFSAPSNNCSAALAPGGTCLVVVNFKPSAVGPRLGTLTVAYAGISLPISLIGKGIAPAVSFNLSSVPCPATTVSLTASALCDPVIIQNVGSAALTVTDIKVTTDASGTIISSNFVSDRTCVTNLTPVQTCRITISFTPRSGSPPATGEIRTANLIVTAVDSAGRTVDIKQPVTVSGTANR